MEENPEPPWETSFELVASRPRASRIAGSTFGSMVVVGDGLEEEGGDLGLEVTSEPP